MIPERIDLKTGFLCNNNCRFCVQAHKKRFGNKPSKELKRLLKESSSSYKGVVFTGGEITIREDIFDLVEYAKKIGYSLIQIQTNARMFAYKNFCLKLIKAGANEFAIAIHGHSSVLHDYLTTSDNSFMQTVNGIANLISLNQKVLTNTVVVKSNYRHLSDICKFLINLGVRQIQFSFVHILGNAAINKYSVVPRKSLVRPYLHEALDLATASNIRATTEAMPYCFMRGYEQYVSEKNIPKTKVYDLDYTIEDFTIIRKEEAKSKGAVCSHCCRYQLCEGPWREYPELFGWDEFKPVIQSRIGR